jgi:predicted DCC family thiol-disulfide oxidoreductase YuxK
MTAQVQPSGLRLCTGKHSRQQFLSISARDCAISIVVQTDAGLLLMRSDAWVHILQRLGGRWKKLAALVAAIPRPLRDVFYNVIARIRYRVFGRRDDLSRSFRVTCTRDSIRDRKSVSMRMWTVRMNAVGHNSHCGRPIAQGIEERSLLTP